MLARNDGLRPSRAIWSALPSRQLRLWTDRTELYTAASIKGKATCRARSDDSRVFSQELATTGPRVGRPVMVVAGRGWCCQLCHVVNAYAHFLVEVTTLRP